MLYTRLCWGGVGLGGWCQSPRSGPRPPRSGFRVSGSGMWKWRHCTPCVLQSHIRSVGVGGGEYPAGSCGVPGEHAHPYEEVEGLVCVVVGRVRKRRV